MMLYLHDAERKRERERERERERGGEIVALEFLLVYSTAHYLGLILIKLWKILGR